MISTSTILYFSFLTRFIKPINRFIFVFILLCFLLSEDLVLCNDLKRLAFSHFDSTSSYMWVGGNGSFTDQYTLKDCTLMRFTF